MFRGLVPSNRRDAIAVRKYDPWDFGRVFENFFNDSFFPALSSFANPIKADIRENDNEYIIEAEIPGVEKDNIKMEVRDNVLTIGLEHKEETNEERGNYIRRERKYGSCSRSFGVENIKQDEIKAKYNNGILTVVLPKAEKVKENIRKIDIQ
jgi:HSP20 family protein